LLKPSISIVRFATHLLRVIITHCYMERWSISLHKINIMQDLHLQANESARFGRIFSNSVTDIWLSDDNTRHFDFMSLYQHLIQIILNR